MREVGTG